MRPRVLLITRYFPPLDSIATMRMHSWAHYLTKFGYQVTVLTTTKHNQIGHPLRLDTTGIDIIEIPYFDPITAVNGDQSKGEGSERFFHRFYRTHMNERMPNRTDFWIWPAIKELRRQKAAGIGYDAIVSSYGPPSSHIVGHYAKKIFGCRWIADYRDLWIENHAYKGIWPMTWVERWVEKKCVGQADVLTTVSEGLRKTLVKKFPKLPVHVITNGFEPQIIDNAGGDFFPKDGVFRVVYTGKLCHGQSKEPFFQALSQLASSGKLPQGRFEVHFYGGSMANLIPAITHHRLQSWVYYGGALPLVDAYRAQQSADALLFLERPDVDGILTGKLFEYLYAAAPILAVGVTPEMEAGRLIQEAGRGIVCGTDVEKIKQVLVEMVEGRLQQTPRCPEKIAIYSREAQATRLQQILR